MPEIDEINIQTQNPTEFSKDESNYDGISNVAGWVEENLGLNLKESEFSSPKSLAQTLVTHIGNCLPIDRGYGNATLSEQLSFWEGNRETFDKAFSRRYGAVDLIKSRQEIIEQMKEPRANLNQVQLGLLLLPNEPMEAKEKEEFSAQLTEEEARLKAEVGKLDSELKATDDQFNQDKHLRKSITSKIDCKLPTVITGQILKNIGWEVGLVSYNAPHHPTLWASVNDAEGNNRQFLIGFDADPNEFNVREADSPRYLSASKKEAEEVGFASDTDPWPLPFNEETFKKFDDWYSEHQNK